MILNFTVMFYVRWLDKLEWFCLMGHDIWNKKITNVSSDILFGFLYIQEKKKRKKISLLLKLRQNYFPNVVNDCIVMFLLVSQSWFFWLLTVLVHFSDYSGQESPILSCF